MKVTEGKDIWTDAVESYKKSYAHTLASFKKSKADAQKVQEILSRYPQFDPHMAVSGEAIWVELEVRGFKETLGVLEELDRVRELEHGYDLPTCSIRKFFGNMLDVELHLSDEGETCKRVIKEVKCHQELIYEFVCD